MTSQELTRPFRHDGGDVGVLLCHGFTGSPASMRPWAEHLAEAGYSVRVPLLPGHGTRWQDMNRTTFDDWFAEVTKALAELRSTCTSVVVCGLSMGGTLTLRLAEVHGDALDGIVLVNPSVMTTRWEARVAGLLAAVVPSLPGIVDDIAKPGVHELGYDRIPVKAAYSLFRGWKTVRKDLGRVTVPVLLMHSRIDNVVEPVNSAIVLAEISSSDVTEVWLENSRHVATLDFDADLIFETTDAFIKRVAQ